VPHPYEVSCSFGLALKRRDRDHSGETPPKAPSPRTRNATRALLIPVEEKPHSFFLLRAVGEQGRVLTRDHHVNVRSSSAKFAKA